MATQFAHDPSKTLPDMTSSYLPDFGQHIDRWRRQVHLTSECGKPWTVSISNSRLHQDAVSS